MLRRWYRRGRLSRSGGMVTKRFPATPTPSVMRRLVRYGRLTNARFAAAVLVRGKKGERPIQLRWDVAVPSLFQIRRQGLQGSPISWATATMASLFVKHFPREEPGVFAPEQLPAEVRRDILAAARERGIRISLRTRTLKASEDVEEEEF
jgi:hypothetical protein